MIIDTYLDETVAQAIYKENQEERENHISSGKLSASMLGQPLQWQILKVMGVEPREVDRYVLRKFKRGNDVEDWLVKYIPGLVETQKEVEYKNVVGRVDAVVDTNLYFNPVGIIPHEIKSVANAKYKRIMEDEQADRGHILQACLYALALKSDHFAIDYIASDDYRITTMLYETVDYADEVEKIIDRFNKQLETKIIPVFEAEEKWQENEMYNSYYDWSKLDQKEINDKYKLLKVKNKE